MKKLLVNVFLLILFINGCEVQSGKNLEKPVEKKSDVKVTFVELGSVNCVPCVQMQPVMKAIEDKYDGQVEVVFYDVWKPDQRHYAQEYGIKLIPTQVFLDENGMEFHRHEGFYPEAEIHKVLQTQGLTVKKQSEN